MKNKELFLFLLLLHFILPCSASAYNDTRTHRELTMYVLEKASLKAYLADKLLITEDITKKLKGHHKEQTILRWMQDGSQMEDAPMCRASNHFHDPTREPWASAGLSDTFWATSEYCSYGDYPFGELSSNLVWATGFTASDQELPSPSGNNWDWNAARIFFYSALSGDSTELAGLEVEEGLWPWEKTTIIGESGLNKAERDKYLAWTFRALGNVMHLLQDASVPAHVRNDFDSHHSLKPKEFIGDAYEHYVKKKNDIIASIKPVEPDYENPTLTDYWDADYWNGAGEHNAGVQNEGLAELVNRKFFSSNTIPNNKPKEEHKFKNPSVGSGTHFICKDSLPNKPDRLRQYISRAPCPAQGEGPADHFVLISLSETEIVPDNSDISMLQLEITDENVLGDYANEILPFTLGYSMELLEYFFRGEIDMQPNPNGTGYIVKNEGDEALTGGTLQLFYDANDGNRYPVNGAEWNVPGDTGIIWAGAISRPIGFVPPTDALEPDKYMLVYRGELGNEKDAVIGKFVQRKRYLVMKRGSTYKQYLFWDIDRNEPARIKRAGSEEFISYPTNPYGDPDVNKFFLSHTKILTEELFIKEALVFTYGDWVEDSYVFTPNGFPSPCDVCNAEYTEERTLIRTLLQAPYVEQVSSTVKELWTDSWDCAYNQGYAQYVCDGQYSSASGWETIETYDYLPYEPLLYDMRVVGGNVQKDIHHLVENSTLYARNMDAEGQIILNLDSLYSSRVDGSGGRDHPTLGNILGVHIRGIREEETLNTWEIVTPWFVHSYSQLNSRVSETQSGRYYGVLSHMAPNFPSRSVLTGCFNEEIVFRAYYLLYRRENALYASNGFPADYEPPLVPGIEEPVCIADSSILVTNDTGSVNPFTDMPDNPDLSKAICDFWKTASAEDGRYNYAVTFAIWE